MDLKKAFMVSLTLLLVTAGLQAQTKRQKVPAKKGLQASIAAGELVFKRQCISCHQADGAGVPNLNPPLIQTTYILGDRTKLVTIVLKGFDEDVEINGQTYSNTMPPQNTLTDQEIADVLTYVRNSFGNKAPAVTVAQVKAIRNSRTPALSKGEGVKKATP